MDAAPDQDERWKETRRLQTLRAYDLLDAPRDPAFDDIARLIALICGTPLAMVSLVDAERQFFLAEQGVGFRETARDVSFCNHALDAPRTMVVPDATRDPRFVDNPLVTGETRIRFYAGHPIRTAAGETLGTLCVLDTEPRPQGLTPVQAEALVVLARQVMDQFELRRVVADKRRADAERLLTEMQFRALTDAMPQMVWSTRPDGFHDFYNARWYQFTGTPPGSTDGDLWNGMFHPEDQARAAERWARSLASGEDYEIEYRLRRADGVYRWTLGRASPVRDETGVITRWFGTCTDIDDLKRLEQGRELVSQELSHRIKNIFAVVSALVTLSARGRPEVKGFAGELRNRINALARAHEFVRPHSSISGPVMGEMTLHAFLQALFKPYADADGAPRVRLGGQDALFDDQAATSVALLFYELATNAAKYGALSGAEGWVELDTRLDADRFILDWRERGGPPVEGAPDRTGFGSSLASLSVEGQLGGRLRHVWAPGGLEVVVDLPRTALSRRRAAEKAASATEA